jgi:signal transduction histidine kinase
MSLPGQPDEESNLTSALAQCCACGVVAIEGEKVTLCTPEAGQLLGLNASRTLKGPSSELPPPLPALAQEVSASGKALPERLLELSPSGPTGPVWGSALPLPSKGAGPGVLFVLKGVISSESLEQQIRHLNRLASIGTLSASIAHELRNALVASRTFVELLLEKNKDSELAGIVQRETTRVDGLVNRILKLAGRDRGAFGPVRLHEVLEHSLLLVQSSLQGRTIEVQRSFQATPDLLNGDRYALEQAFVNLLLNSLDAIGERGRLIVETSRTGIEAPHLQVTISDTGDGIAPANMERMFEPFFTTKPAGTGLGLVITRRIVHEHRGELSMESSQGKGTTVQIRFPSLRENG